MLAEIDASLVADAADKTPVDVDGTGGQLRARTERR